MRTSMGAGPCRTRPYATVTMPQTARLVRLPDDPSSLPAALSAVWDAGDAALVAPPDATLPPAAEAALAGRADLPDGTGLVVPTSGSTGVPRLVVLARDALAASTAASVAALGCEPGERWLLALPLRHIAGLQVLARVRALSTEPVVVADPGDPQAIAAAAADAEFAALVPTQLLRCLDAGAEVVAALARLRGVLVGGGPADRARLDEARERGVRLVLSYGMTETCGGCVYDGRPLPGVEVAVDADAGGPGPIRLRGPMLATGELVPTADGGATVDRSRFADGWLNTDDVGTLGAEGTLQVMGRADRTILTGGVNVDPEAVERALSGNATVADVVVVGVPDAEWGQRVRAVVVPTDPSDPPTLERLRDVVRTTLPASHAPREVVLVEQIPRDGMGKVTKDGRRALSS